MPRTRPVRGSRKIAAARSPRWSSVNDPPGPERVTLARRPAHSARTGSAKAKLEPPSPPATSGMSKLSEKSSPPEAVRPVSS